jgi:hypothetical protein
MMRRTQDWEDEMFGYLRLVTLALLAMTAISVATVAPAMAYEQIIYCLDGDGS